MPTEKNFSTTNENNDVSEKKGSVELEMEDKIAVQTQQDDFQNEQFKTEKSLNQFPAQGQNPLKKKRSLGSLLGFDEIKSTFKRSREQNKNVKKYAIAGIILAICSVALVWPCFYGGVGIFNFLMNSLFSGLSGATGGNIVLVFLIGIIGALVFGVLGIFLFLLPAILALFSLILPVFQLIMNRKWWSWVSLAFGVIAVAACILIMLHLLQSGF